MPLAGDPGGRSTVAPRCTYSALAKSLRGGLAAIVETCLRRSPEARYASADALAADLQRWLEHRPVDAAQLGKGERVALWLRRNRLLAAAVGAVAIALIAGTSIALWQANEARSQARIAGQQRIHRAQDSLLFIERYERRRLLMIHSQTISYDLFGIIISLVRFTAANLTAIPAPGGLEGTVIDLAASATNPPSRKTENDSLVIDIEKNHTI